MITDNWEIEIGGVTVGKEPPLKLSDIDFGTTLEWRTQATENPIGDNWLFGEDHLTPPTMTLTVQAVGSGGNAAIHQLAAVWRHRLEPGQDMLLRYMANGQVRRVYGRPRNFTPVPTKGIPDRLATITAEFQLTDPLYFEDALRSETLTIVPPSTGGFTVPFTVPLIVAGTGEIQGIIDDVGGTARTPVIIKFIGPITNPYIEGDDWLLELNTSLAHDETITIDTRKMTVRRNDGAYLGGTLSRKSRLSRIRLRPGTEHFVFGGSDATGTARCVVSWYPANNSY